MNGANSSRMLITEFRIPMPFTLEEYKRGQIYTTLNTSIKESQYDEGIEVLVNEPFGNHPELPRGYTSGQYTSKVYNFVNRFPFFIRALAPKSAMLLVEESWNSYPFCRTILTNPKMKGDFFIKIDSFHSEGRLNQENPHQLSPEQLDRRKIVVIDIGNDPLPKDWKRDTVSPSQFIPAKAERGPLTEDWIHTVEPVMTCYKLVQVQFKWFGLQKKVESFIMKTERKLFTSFHRHMFVWMNEWYDLSMEQLRAMELEGDGQLAEKAKQPTRNLSRYQTSAYTIR